MRAGSYVLGMPENEDGVPKCQRFDPSTIPAMPGLYVLHARLAQARTIRVGRLGEFFFEPGSYLYIGSARGPGGLRARIARHVRSTSSLVAHWHIDLLLKPARILGVWWYHDPPQSECEWAAMLATAGRRWPKSFGTSDCGCAGHLLHFDSASSTTQAMHNPAEIFGRDLGNGALKIIETSLFQEN